MDDYIYFKQRFVTVKREWTLYGKYNKDNIRPEGDILCTVDDIAIDPKMTHIDHSIHQYYFEEYEITKISSSEYSRVIEQIRQAEGYLDIADAIFKTLI